MKLTPEQARRLDALLTAEGIADVADAPIPRRGADGPVPLSGAQHGLWLAEQRGPGSVALRVPFALRLAGRLDVAALVAAWADVVRRHEVLRTAFDAVEGEPVQSVQPPQPADLPLVDLTRRPEPESALGAELDAHLRCALDLASGRCLDVRLYRTAPEVHVLSIVFHHIVFDGWSANVLVGELLTAYEARRAGRAPELATLPLQVADYAAWEASPERSRARHEQLEYWKRRLEGVAHTLDLPVDHPRTSAASLSGAHVTVALDAPRARTLRRLARRYETTPFVVALAAYAAALARWTGQCDVVVGTVVAGRDRLELEPLIGCFVNTLPLVAREVLGEDPERLVQRLRTAVGEALERPSVPLEQVVDAVVERRDPLRPPLCQAMFAYQTASTGTATATTRAGLEIAPEGKAPDVARYELLLTVLELGDAIALNFEYRSDLFTRASVERLAARFLVALDVLDREPSTPWHRIDLLDDDERDRLAAWRGRLDPVHGVGMHRMVEEQARRRPEAIALRGESEPISYAALNGRANRIARALRRRGVLPGARIGVLGQRSAAMVLAELAILKAGAVYVPLDPDYPDERLRELGRTAELAGVLTCAPWHERAPAVGADAVVLRVDAAAAEWSDEPTADLDVDLPPGAAAYVLFTSGSTGRPKGVVVPHRAIVRLVEGASYVPEPSSNVAHVSSPSFDAATFEVWVPLGRGGTVTVVDKEVVLDPGRFGEVAQRERIDAAFLTTALINRYAAVAPEALAPLGRVVFGGERAEPVALRAVLAHAPGVQLVHAYGPTENTTFSTVGVVAELDPDARSVPIGRPIRGTVVEVLDDALRRVPIGSIGELCVGGHGLAHGYLAAGGATAAAYVPDPYAETPGARLYRTGDLVRWLADGRLEFIGRRDGQVKIRGHRIEPDETRTYLVEHPDVCEAEVVARRDDDGRHELVAYAVAGTDVRLDPTELRAYLRERLPDYMVPSRYVQLEALPLRTTGKVDRDALPEPDAFVSASATYVAPRTEVERDLVELCQEVLGVERVGIDDGFFDLGGDSLLAVQLKAQAEQRGIEIAIEELFELGTVRRLAPTVRTAVAPGREPERPRPREAPLSFAQSRLWFIDRLEPGRSTYNVPLAVRLRGPLDVDALRGALDAVTERHAVLRTSFVERDGAPVQVVADSARIPIRRRELSEPEIATWVQGEAWAGFDLEHGPLARVALGRLGDDDHVLVLVFHHIISDGWSMGLFFRELSLVYRARASGASVSLPALPIQYADHAREERERLTGETLEQKLSFWRDALSGAPPVLELPTDRPRPPVQRNRGAVHAFSIDARTHARLVELGRAENATLFMAVLAAFAALLSRYSGQEDLVVGSPVANRTRAEVASLIGFFVNTLALRVDTSGRPTYRELLRRVRARAVAAYTHQDLPFELLVESLNPPRALSHTPVFQVMLSLEQEREVGRLQLGELDVEPLDAGHTIAKFDLNVTLYESREGLHGVVEYDSDLFLPRTIERLVKHFNVLLDAVAAGPDRRPCEVPLGGSDAGSHPATTADAGAAARCAGARLHERVEQQCERTPAAVAIDGAEGCLTYAELDARATRAATWLRHHGVAPGDRVGVLLERCELYAVSMLAAWKAGATFVPLDPTLPLARLRAMAADARVRAVMADSERSLAAASFGEEIRIDARTAARRAAPGAAPAVAVPPDAPAAVFYTSGSTGQPKGIALSHRALATSAESVARLWELGPGDRVLSFASVGFDTVLEEHLPALVCGAGVVLFPAGDDIGAGNLLDVVTHANVTVLDLPTAYAETVATELARRGERLPRDVRLLTVGGEAASRDGLRRWFDVAPHARWWNSYGPTETTITATWYPVADGAAARALDVAPPIGRPRDGVRVYLLDRHLGAVPPGAIGEIFVAGAGVATGYVGAASATAAAFLPDPFSPTPGARMYRTGDLGRRVDGDLHFVGRVDEQVKVRGFRVEPGEIEAALRAFPEVADAAVVLRGDGAGEAHLIAYVVAAGEQLDPVRLRDGLARVLPHYMVPSRIVELDALPLTERGKLDRDALPRSGAGAAPTPYVAPATPTEKVMASLWSDVLGTDGVGREHDFFALGGHSLLAVRLFSRIRDIYEVEPPIVTVFANPSLRAFCAALDADPMHGPDVIECSRTLLELQEMSEDELDAELAADADATTGGDAVREQ